MLNIGREMPMGAGATGGIIESEWRRLLGLLGGIFVEGLPLR